MTSIASVPIENPRAQCIVMLFAALHEKGGCHSKQETISFIREHHWFDIREEDRTPYPSATTNEPRWHTLIAWGRKDAVVAELMFSHGQDQWELTRRGIEEFRSVRAQYQSGVLEARRCYLWSVAFKQWMVPSFLPSDRDWPRPKDTYRDIQPLQHRNVRARVRQTLLDEL
jgi:hypothetical protein